MCQIQVHPLIFHPYYPQDNGQTEISNHTIVHSLCKSLDKAKGKWWRLFGVL